MISDDCIEWLADNRPEDFAAMVEAWADPGARQQNIATAFRLALEASPEWVGMIISLEPEESLGLLRIAYAERSAVVLGRKIGPGWIGLRELVMDCMNLAAIDAVLMERRKGPATTNQIPAGWATGKRPTAKDTHQKKQSEQFMADKKQVEFGF